MDRVQHRLNEARNPNVSGLVWCGCSRPRSSSPGFPLNATDNDENLHEKSGEVWRLVSNTPAGRVMPVWRNPGHGCVRRSGSPLRASVCRRAEIRDSGPTRMTRGKPSWLGFKPAPRMHSSRHPLLRIVARSLALQPGIGFRIVSKLFLALGSRFSVASHAQCGQLVKIVFVSLSLSLFLFRFACASRGGIGGVVERKAEIDFHGRVARSLPTLLIGNCVPAIDKTAECESWEYVERSFHGFVCVFTGEIREKGGEFEEGGKGVADFRRKIYI